MSTRKKSNLDKQEVEDSHIKVYIRLRPLRNQFSRKCLKIIDKGVALNFKDKIHQLYYDGSFDQTATQQKIFQQTCEPIVKDVLNGNNCSLFVYGQTGTGKTYTMGTLQTIKREDQGLIPLSLNYIINHLSKLGIPRKQWSVSVSFMQIYMEDIFDLLNPTNGKLMIREDIEHGQTYVEDLVIVPIDNYEQSIDLINAGLKYRKTGNQRMNQLSSRSHTILHIYVSRKVSQTQYMASTFSLIDLAGSQRIKKSNSVQLRLDQAKFINTSLSALGNVISSLAQNNSQKFIPYRSSKLTRILKNSLTGHSKVSVICTIQTSQQNHNQTYSTLLFADRCKQIRFPNQPVITIQTFEEIQQQRNMKISLERAQQKEKQYLQIIRNLQQNGSRISRQSSRELELSQIIQSIYKLFGQINSHLKKVLDPQQSKSDHKQKHDFPKVTSSTPTASIKSTITATAQQTIQHINTLSSLAFGESKIGGVSGASRLQTEALTSIVLDMMRQNLKLYETILIKDEKDALQKQISLEQYEKEKKSQVINKLKSKKLKSLQSTFQEIWSQGQGAINPLQSLLQNIRKGEMTLYNQKTSVRNSEVKQLTNPKQFLKMLTKKQSERKHKQMLIDQGDSQNQNYQRSQSESNNQNGSQNLGGSSAGKGSAIKYFQNKGSPNRSNLQSSKKSQQSRQERQSNSNSEIKKLLDSLIASKSQFQQRKKGYFNNQ